jgi:SAM-dependent methyltransferase
LPDPSRHYRGQEGDEYASGRFDQRTEFGRRYQSRFFAPFCNQHVVLVDLGCGDGALLSCLPAARRIGIEVNPTCIHQLQQRNAALDVPIEVVPAAAELPACSADVVISNHCLEHLPDPFASLTELRRVLKPRGRLVLVTPFDDWRSPRHHRWDPGDKDHHLYTWSPLNLGNLLEEAGFEVETARISSFAWSPRIFWIHHSLGERAFRLAGRLLSRLRQRREVHCVARKPAREGTGDTPIKA